MLLLISHFSDCILIERHKPINSLIASFGGLYFAASRLNRSLYHQKHAFYFREVKKWVDFLSVNFETPRSTLWLLTVLQRVDFTYCAVMTLHWLASAIYLTTLNAGYMHRDDLDGYLKFVGDDLLTNLEVTMFGISAVPKGVKPPTGSPTEDSSGSVIEELKMFGKECKSLMQS